MHQGTQRDEALRRSANQTVDFRRKGEFEMAEILDQGAIRVSGTSTDYDSDVAAIVRGLLATQTGRAIATKIQTHGTVLITDDYPGKLLGEYNAEFDPALGKNNKTLGIVVFHPQDATITTAKIFYNGKEISVAQVRSIQRNYAGFQPDEIVFHELVHAARYLGGDFKQTPIPKMPDYDNEEEYFAVLVTNIYSSEKGRSFASFRKSHRLRLKPGMNEQEADPWAFLLEDDNYRLVEKFCKQHPTIAPIIAHAPADFNPIRDYYDLKRGVLPLNLKVVEDVPVPIRITQNEPRVPVTDYYLMTLLEPRYRSDDVAGYGGRAREVEKVFRSMPLQEASPLLVRLLKRSEGDRIAAYFHGHLATATRKKLISILITTTGRAPH
jgi:hypothetical protein